MTPAPVADDYRRVVGTDPAGLWMAPGRVNLIGEHTDYNGGFVLPFALTQAAMVAAGPRFDGRVLVWSRQYGESRVIEPERLVPGSVTGWPGYLAGVIWALREAGHAVPGVNLVLDSHVPIGAGLASSAAIECAAITALVDLFDLPVSLLDRAIIARHCENAFVGAPTGLMDQAVSILATAHHALFLDCRTLTTEQVPLPGLDPVIVVIDTQQPHRHADGAYADRRRACVDAARLLGVDQLRDVPDVVALQGLPPDLRRRARHVVTENQRVLDTVEALRAGDVVRVGALMSESHLSLRHDFEVSAPPLDRAVEVALAAGALGARMTGGGFGGCAIALISASASHDLAERMRRAFAQAGFHEPRCFVAEAGSGAHKIDEHSGDDGH